MLKFETFHAGAVQLAQQTDDSGLLSSSRRPEDEEVRKIAGFDLCTALSSCLGALLNSVRVFSAVLLGLGDNPIFREFSVGICPPKGSFFVVCVAPPPLEHVRLFCMNSLQPVAFASFGDNAYVLHIDAPA